MTKSIDQMSATEIVAKACAAYGVQTLAELKETNAWKEAAAKIGDERLTLRNGIRFIRQKGDVNGFYLWQDPFTEWDGATKTKKVKSERAMILLENGETVAFWSEAGKKNLADAPRFTRVTVSGAEVKTDIYTGEVKVNFPKGSTLDKKDHTSDFPDVNLSRFLSQDPENLGLLYQLDKGKKSLDTVVFSTDEGYATALATLVIKDATYFPQGQYNESLRVTAHDSLGSEVEVALDPVKIRNDLSLPEDKDLIQDTLKGELLIASGTLTRGDRRPVSGFKPEEQQLIMTAIQGLENAGVMAVYSTTRYGELRGTSLRGWLGTDGKQVTTFDVGGHRCFVLRQEPNKDKASGEKVVEWVLYEDRGSLNRPPKLDTIVRSGVAANGPWTMNENGAALFPRLQTTGVSEDDPFLQALKAA